MLDPWPRLLSRPVIWNDGPQVGEVQMLADDPAARRLGAVIAAPARSPRRSRPPECGSSSRTAAPAAPPGLRAPAVRRARLRRRRRARPGGRLPGCAVVAAAPGLVVYRVPGREPR